MKREQPRPDYGWETILDVFAAIERRLPFGEVTLRRAGTTRTGIGTTLGDWEIGWHGTIAGRSAFFGEVIAEETLTRMPASRVAERYVAQLRGQLDELGKQIALARRAGEQR